MDVLVLKWKLGNVLHWERAYAFVSKGKAMDSFQINKEHIWWGKPPENIDYRHEENNYEKLQGR